MDKKLLIKKYCEALENGRAAIFAGAGLSVGAGFVDWKGLLSKFGLKGCPIHSSKIYSLRSL